MARSPGIPVTQLARDLGVSAGELRRRLVRCRMVRHVRPDDSIPQHLVDQVVRAVKVVHADPRMDVASDADFDAVMARQGVKKLAGGQQTRSVPRPAAPPTPRPSVVSGGGSRDRRSEVLQEQVGDLQRQLEAAMDAKQAAERELAELQGELESRTGLLERSLDTTESLASHSQALRNRLHTLETEEQRRRSGLSLESVLRQRGLTGEDERAAAVRALIATRRWSQISAQLKPIDQHLLEATVERYVVLHCGSEKCPVPAAVAAVLVAGSRCELCGGHGQRVAMLRFSEGLMLNGMRRIAVVGGTPLYQRVLRDGLDQRIECRLLLGDSDPGDDPPRLVIDWDPLERNREFPRLTASGARLVRIPDRSLAEMLDAVLEHLEAC